MKKLFYSAGLILCTCILLVIVVISCKKKKDSDSPALCAFDCKNGGTCSNKACNCPDEWTGATCETYYTALYVGNYSRETFNCSGSYAYNTSTILTVSLNAYNKSMLNFGYFFGILTDKTHFTIPGQTPLNSGVTISGSGTINGNSMTISYDGSIFVGNHQNAFSSCSGTFTKQ